MGKGARLVISILSILIFTGCKTKQKLFVRSNIKTDSSIVTSKDKNVYERNVWLADTIVKVDADTLSGSFDWTEGQQTIESDEQVIMIENDPATKKSRIKTISKAKKVPVKISVEQTKITDEQEHTEAVIKKDISYKEQAVKSSGFSLPWWVWILFVTAVLAAGYFTLKKQYK